MIGNEIVELGGRDGGGVFWVLLVLLGSFFIGRLLSFAVWSVVIGFVAVGRRRHCGGVVLCSEIGSLSGKLVGNGYPYRACFV